MSDPRISMTWRQAMEWRSLHGTLYEVLIDVLSHWPDDCAEVTCIHRTPEEDRSLDAASGIHAAGPPFRAIDLRIKDWGPGYQSQADSVASRVNARWSYDPGRPMLNVVVSRPHGTGPHMHIQVHQATRRRD